MRILLVPAIYLPSIGGVELNTHQLAVHLSKIGHKVIVLTSKKSRWRLLGHEQIDGITVFRLPFYVFKGTLKSFIAFLIFSPIALAGTYLLIRKVRPDVINVHFTGANAFYIFLCNYLRRIPLIVSFHGNEVVTLANPLEFGFQRTEAKWIKWATSLLLRRADYITANSEKLIEQVDRDNDELLTRSRRILFSGLRDEHVRTSTTSKHQPYILAVGRLHKEKGFDLLIDAFRGISDSNPNLSLIVIGDGPERERLAKRIQQHNLENRVILAGALPRNRLESYYENSLFLVLASRREGLPSVILESFSYGKPVIATVVGGITEAVNDGHNGLLVEPENIKQLTIAMEKLLKDASLRAAFGANAKTFMDEIGNWDKVAQRYCEVYQLVLRGR